MRIVIVGTGAMACLFAARLASVAHVTLIGTWSEAIASIRKRGILVEHGSETRTVAADAAYIGTSLPAADLIVVLVKSWQTASIAGYLDGYLAPEGIILSLQNGLGNIELLGPKACPGVTATGATLVGPGHVRTGGTGPTHMVAPEPVAELFRRAGFECHRCESHEAESLIWGKLTISCGINALTAILRVPNGELLNRPNAADLMARAALECYEVAGARGVKLPFSDPVERVREVALRTAANRSSMLQDLLRGAPTECDAINGAVVGEGKRLGIPTPVNEILWQLIQSAVHQKRSGLQQ